MQKIYASNWILKWVLISLAYSILFACGNQTPKANISIGNNNRSVALYVAVERVNPKFYDGNKLRLNHAASDLRKVQTQLGGKFTPIWLQTEQATRSNILDTLDFLANDLRMSDMLLIYLIGHGESVNDRFPFDELDLMDETFLTFDGRLFDDELSEKWHRFNPGVKIIIISDCCHSGTFYKMVQNTTSDFIDTVNNSEQFGLLSIGACEDGLLSSYFCSDLFPEKPCGYFTDTFIEILKTGQSANYFDFFDNLVKYSQKKGRPSPTLNLLGQDTAYFRHNIPFDVNKSVEIIPNLNH